MTQVASTGSTGSDGGKEAASGIGHATTDAIQVKAELPRWVEQLLGCFIEREPTGRRLLKDAFAHQIPEHLLQGVGITPCFLGKRLNVSGAGGDVVGNPQGCHHVDAPGRAEIAQRAEIGAGPWCLVTCHLLFLLIGFLMAPARAPRLDLDLLGPRLDLYSEAERASGQ
jgi:hypothetical protein